MLYWLFYWIHLVFILSNFCNITSQYCMKLCNNMAYTSHHHCKPNWPQLFNCSHLLTQIFLVAASSLRNLFQTGLLKFIYLFICLVLRFPLGQRSQTFLLTRCPLLELSTSIFLQLFCQKAHFASILEVSVEEGCSQV